MSLPVVYEMERGRRTSEKILHSHRAVVRALGWESVEDALGGKQPTVASEGPQVAVEAPPGDLPEGLSERAKRALSSGRVVDSVVIPASPGVRVSLVVTADDGVPPEQLTDDFFAWFDRVQDLVRQVRPSLSLGPEGESSPDS